MKVLLEIDDTKAEFIMELLENFSFVRAEPILEEEDEILAEADEVEEAAPTAPIEHVTIEPVKPVKKGKRRPKAKTKAK